MTSKKRPHPREHTKTAWFYYILEREKEHCFLGVLHGSRSLWSEAADTPFVYLAPFSARVNIRAHFPRGDDYGSFGFLLSLAGRPATWTSQLCLDSLPFRRHDGLVSLPRAIFVKHRQEIFKTRVTYATRGRDSAAIQTSDQSDQANGHRVGPMSTSAMFGRPRTDMGPKCNRRRVAPGPI